MTPTAPRAATLTIGPLSKHSGVAAKTIRYYEEIGLIPEAKRAANGYRYYEARAIHILRFVGRARELGFAIEEVRELLTLWNDKRRKSSDVRAIAKAHLETIEDKITKLQTMHGTLQHLVQCCRGDDRPDCPILDELSTQKNDNMSTYKIQGMTCGGCVSSVTKALNAALPGVEFQVTLATNHVRIEGEHDPKLVKNAIENAGFDFGGPTDPPTLRD